MANTLNGVLFNVTYELRVFIKHDTLLATGEGVCIKVPLVLYDIPHLPTKSPNDPSIKNNTQALIDEALKTVEHYDPRVYHDQQHAYLVNS